MCHFYLQFILSKALIIKIMRYHYVLKSMFLFIDSYIQYVSYIFFICVIQNISIIILSLTNSV